MKNYGRSYPYLSLCGLNCSLCTMHLSGYCPGCGGERETSPARSLSALGSMVLWSFAICVKVFLVINMIMRRNSILLSHTRT